MTEGKRLYLLDTNVLMHDPTALFRFEEHDIFLPMVVLEELDAAKKGTTEVARNVRQVSRFLGQLMNGGHYFDEGIELKMPDGLDIRIGTGKLYFQTGNDEPDDHPTMRRAKADNEILHAAMKLRQTHPDRKVVLVSKDINLRIKASIHGIPAEDYHNDRALDDLSLLYGGISEFSNDFWERHPVADSWTSTGHTFYRLGRIAGDEWHPNQCLKLTGDNGMEARVRDVTPDDFVLQVCDDFRHGPKTVWGINARNTEQNFALNLLMDPDVDFITLLGTAGTGKTLLTLAAGLVQTLDERIYREIIMTRATVSVGDEIGYLPGTEEEKMTPWMGALTDNLEVLTEPDGGDWGRAVTNDLLASRIKIRSLNFMRGRTFLNRYLIIDEAQNLTPKQMKTLITRAGPGTKIVCLGNIEQIDTPYLTETTSGLTFAVDRFKDWAHSGHVTLRRGERSRLADFASEAL
ncbi:MAG: PhoH family protein [Wenzhouxiangellaceae bacterium]|nr:PhoH family protein [Wenzhouxiangellaceae bacterium]